MNPATEGVANISYPAYLSGSTIPTMGGFALKPVIELPPAPSTYIKLEPSAVFSAKKLVVAITPPPRMNAPSAMQRINIMTRFLKK